MGRCQGVGGLCSHIDGRTGSRNSLSCTRHFLCAGIPLECERRSRIPSPCAFIRRQSRPNLGGATHGWCNDVSQPHNRHRNIPVSVVTGAELPVNVVAPAGGGTVRKHSTRVVVAASDVSDSFAGELRKHDDRYGCVRVGGGAVTELAVTVVSPAGDCAI